MIVEIIEEPKLKYLFLSASYNRGIEGRRYKEQTQYPFCRVIKHNNDSWRKPGSILLVQRGIKGKIRQNKEKLIGSRRSRVFTCRN